MNKPNIDKCRSLSESIANIFDAAEVSTDEAHIILEQLQHVKERIEEEEKL